MADTEQKEEILQQVRQRYSDVVRRRQTSCCSGSSCCNSEMPARDVDKAVQMGYTAEEASSVPDGANMSLGCGNPGAIAALRPGEVVLDLGSGGGFDCFLAARQVGESGRVIGVDMTPDMLSKARENAAKGGYTNVEFRLGEIEHLPVADNSVDVILSNCVINLSPDKRAVFQEAYRVLRSGGRLAIADIVATAALPESVRQDLALWAGCIAGATAIGDIESMLRKAGFERIRIQPRDSSREMIREWAPGRKLEEYIVSATIEALKP